MIQNTIYKIPNTIFKWLTRTRRRKILSSILAVLMILTSIRFLFLKPTEVKADVFLKFDEGYGTSSAVNDTNGAVSAGSIANAAWQTEDLCKSGKCLYFDGDGDYVSFADDYQLNIGSGDTVTIEGWFRTSDITSGTRVLIAKHNSTAGGYKVYMDSNGYLIFGIDPDSTWSPSDTASTSPTAFDDNKWHFFSVVKDGTSSISIYVDGILYQTDSSITSGSLINTDTFYIGIDGDGASNDYQGFIDEVRILRTEKSQTEIITDYLGGTKSSSGPGPVGWWRMDEASWNGTAGEVKDSSGNEINGTRGDNATTTTSGKFNNAGSFDGTDDNVSISEASAVDLGTQTDSYTLEGWFKTSASYSTSAIIVCKNDGSGAFPYCLFVNASEQVMYCMNTVGSGCAGGNPTSVSSSQTYSDGNWHHAAAVRDTSTDTIYLYVDGYLVNQATDASTDSAVNDDAISIGNGGTSSTQWDFNGQLDDIRIYNYARLQTQILEDMAGYPPAGISASFGPDQSYLSNGLVGYWKMDDNVSGASQTIKDSSGNNYDGTTVNSPDCTVSGKFGFGCDFTGDTETDRINMGDVDGIDNIDLTLAAWINVDDYSVDEGAIIAKDDLADGSFYFRVMTDGSLQFAVNPIGSSNKRTAAGVISTDTWYHVVVVYENNGDNSDATIYVNGASQANIQSNPPLANLDSRNAYFTIGRRDTNFDEFDGTIDEARVYNRALSPAEVASLYKWAPGPYIYYKFDEGTGTSTVNDGSGNSINGDMTGSMTEDDWVQGKYGKSLSFDGQDDYINILDTNNRLDFGTNADFTFSTWVRTDSETCSSHQHILERYTGTVNIDLGCIDAEAYFQVRDNLSNNKGASGASSPNNIYITDGQWHYITGVKDDDQIIIYTDGIEQDRDTQTYTGNFITTVSLKVGSRTTVTPSYWDGEIDEVKVYNYARTPEQIVSDMNAGHPAPGSPVGSETAYWKFDEGYGTTANDPVNDKDLTLNTASWTNNGKYGKAWNGDQAEWLYRTDDDDLDFTASDDFTISTWFKSDTAGLSSGKQIILTKGSEAGPGYQLYFRSSYNQVTFATDDDTSWGGGSDQVLSTSDVYDGEWHNIVAVRKGSSTTMKLYIDGDLEDKIISFAETGTLENSSTLYLGDLTGVDDANGELDGDIDETKIYRFALTADQVATEYNRGMAAVFGSTSTNTSGTGTLSAGNEYCPPGQGFACVGPVAEWKMDENSGAGSNAVKDTSGNGNHGTMSSSMTEKDWVPGKYNSGLRFSGYGSGDRVEANSVLNSFTKSNPWTITGWVKILLDDDLNDQYFFAMVDESANEQVSLAYDETDDDIKVFSNGKTAGNGSDMNTKQWYYVGLVWDGADFHAYLDGKLDYSVTPSSAISWGGIDGFRIGSTVWAGVEQNEMNGDIDQVRIYNYARTQAQMAWEYNRGGPVGWWKLDDNVSGDNQTIHDSSRNGNDGTTSDSDSTLDCTGTGKRDLACDFDGSDDYITVADDSSLRPGNGSWTLSAWAKPSNQNQGNGIVCKRQNSGPFPQYCMGIAGTDTFSWTPGKKLNFTFYDSNLGNLRNGYTNRDVADGNWHHFTAVADKDADSIRLYVDGKEEPITMDHDTGSWPNITNTDSLYIGQTNGGGYFNGPIDNVRIYNYALTQQQINDIYNEGAVKFGP